MFVSSKSGVWNAQQESVRLAVRQYDAEQNNKPVLLSVSDLSIQDSFSTTKSTTAIITNPLNKHAAVCVKGRILAFDSKASVDSNVHCFNDIEPHTTVSYVIPISDINGTIGTICYDKDKYDTEYQQYIRDLDHWQTLVADYSAKVSQNPAYTQALEILSGKRPISPEKVFSWKSCGSQLIDAFPDKIQSAK